ncbi:MAG: metal ABC transporter permease [Phycisphaerales bacterium]|nr:metal ABC transporter permease [Phycisphaerales bacterium]
MTEFFQALAGNALLQNALLAGVIASVACGVMGSYVVARRITYIAGGVAHCVLGGMGAARYLNVVGGWTWLQPLHGAIFAALLAAGIIGWVSQRSKEREDTVISALWAIGMAVGVLFIAKTPGYYEDLMSYLFGNVLLVSGQQLRLIVLLDVVVVGLGLLLYNPFLAVCFDQEFARLRGLNVELYYLLLLGLTALTVVVLVTVVGLVMVIALLTLPVAVAGHFVHRLWHVMLLSCLLSAALTAGGLMVSYGPDLPPGAVTIVLAGGLYLLVLCGRRLIRAF